MTIIPYRLFEILIKSILPAFFITLLFSISDFIEEYETPELFLKVSIKTSIDSTAQMFYNTGNGFNEKDSHRVKVNGNSRFDNLEFPLPIEKGNIKKIRFDPLRAEGKVVIKHILLVDRYDRLIQDVDLESVKARNQIQSLEIINGSLAVQTMEKAKDPILQFKISYPFFQRITDTMVLYLGDALKKFVVVFLLSWTALMFFEFDEKGRDPEQGAIG
jgi:hypothetical protein